MKSLQAVLGHSSVNITLSHYSHLLGGEVGAVAERINEVFGRVIGV